MQNGPKKGAQAAFRQALSDSFDSFEQFYLDSGCNSVGVRLSLSENRVVQTILRNLSEGLLFRAAVFI